MHFAYAGIVSCTGSLRLDLFIVEFCVVLVVWSLDGLVVWSLDGLLLSLVVWPLDGLVLLDGVWWVVDDISDYLHQKLSSNFKFILTHRVTLLKPIPVKVWALWVKTRQLTLDGAIQVLLIKYILSFVAWLRPTDVISKFLDGAILSVVGWIRPTDVVSKSFDGSILSVVEWLRSTDAVSKQLDGAIQVLLIKYILSFVALLVWVGWVDDISDYLYQKLSHNFKFILTHWVTLLKPTPVKVWALCVLNSVVLCLRRVGMFSSKSVPHSSMGKFVLCINNLHVINTC